MPTAYKIEELVAFLEQQATIDRCPVSESCQRLGTFISSHEEPFAKELEPAQNPYSKQGGGGKKKCLCL